MFLWTRRINVSCFAVSSAPQPVTAVCGIIEIMRPLELGIQNNVSFILMSCRHPIKNPCIFVHYISSRAFRPAAPDHGSHRGPGGDQQQGGEGRADQGLPRPPGQRQPGHLSVDTIINWIHLKPLRSRLNSFSSRLCNININIIEPKNWIYHYEPPAAKIDAIHF